MSTILGDCLGVLKDMKDNSVDSIITDPPYELNFMNKNWDNSGIANKVELWSECLRVLKPGGHLLSFGGTRTDHRMICAIEDAGFEIRDKIAWLYGCLSEDTEILTIKGWERYHKDIDKNPVLTYNISSDSFVFDKPLRSFYYVNEHPAYRIQSDYTDQIVSRNHRVIVEQNGKLLFKFAEEVAQEQKANVPFLESLCDLPEDIPNLYEGTSITKQSLQKLCFKSDEETKEKAWKNKRIMGNKELRLLSETDRSKDKTNKEEPKNLLQSVVSCKRSLQALITLLQQREGKVETWNRIKRTIKSCVERWSNLFQQTWELWNGKIYKVSDRIFTYGTQGWLCCGAQNYNGEIIKSLFNENRSCSPFRSQSNQQFFKQSNVIPIQSGAQKVGRTTVTVTEIEYSGNFWCVEVPSGAFVARRNGKIFITGNSGFPKSNNISKSIDKIKGAKREVVGKNPNHRTNYIDAMDMQPHTGDGSLTIPPSSEAKTWDGWGSALKPAHEDIVLARKPLTESTIAKNVLRWGTGGINVDGSRVGTEEIIINGIGNDNLFHGKFKNIVDNPNRTGRFPANLILDDSECVRKQFPNSKNGSIKPFKQKTDIQFAKFGEYRNCNFEGDSVSAARFFYCAKTSKAERNLGCEELEEKKYHGSYTSDLPKEGSIKKYGKEEALKKVRSATNKNSHPTIKPQSLMRYLITLITPPKGIVLDPFMGSGSTGVAAYNLGFDFMGIEKQEDYYIISNKRINYAVKGKSEDKLLPNLFNTL